MSEFLILLFPEDRIRLCVCNSGIIEHDLLRVILNACCRIFFSRI